MVCFLVHFGNGVRVCEVDREREKKIFFFSFLVFSILVYTILTKIPLLKMVKIYNLCIF